MCGRATLTRQTLEELAEELGVAFEPGLAARYRPRYNLAPSDEHWIVIAGAFGPELIPSTWGMPGRGRRPMINLRGESGARAFRDAGRCVVPTDGFFEWFGPRKDRRPFWFHDPDGALLLLAGLCQPDGSAFTILTRPALGAVRLVHDRMPVVLARDGVPAWLHRETTDPIVLAAPDRLVATPVSSRVNRPANDDPACLASPEGGAHGQAELLLPRRQ
jgi:putative SOS response-associated peptidase YedK